MIVWLASFPRSGNTFLRILLNRLYGVQSSVVYDVDGVAERLGRGFVGFESRPASYGDMRSSSTIHFVKTHRQRDSDVDAGDRAICLVRDGRDCLVSWARMESEAEPDLYESKLREMIDRTGPIGTGSWGANVLSWLVPEMPNRVILRYEELTADPEAATRRIVSDLVPDLRPVEDASVPDFATLRATDDGFFRRGLVGSYRDELPSELHARFWSRPDNLAATALLGIDPPGEAANASTRTVLERDRDAVSSRAFAPPQDR